MPHLRLWPRVVDWTLIVDPNKRVFDSRVGDLRETEEGELRLVEDGEHRVIES